MKNLIREEYDRLWTQKWGDEQRFGPVHRHQRELLVKTIGSLGISTMLDVGCGSGDNLAAIAHTMPHVKLSGADVSPEALALLQQRVPNASLHQMDIQREKLNHKFDLVFANQVIEHLLDDMAALTNMAQMASGWVLVATMRGRMRRSEISIGHFRNYSDIELRVKAEKAGLEVVDIFGWGFPFYSPLYRTAVEWLPAGPPKGEFGTVQKAIANLLYHLYSLNVPRLGDVVTMIARPRS